MVGVPYGYASMKTCASLYALFGELGVRLQLGLRSESWVATMTVALSLARPPMQDGQSERYQLKEALRHTVLLNAVERINTFAIGKGIEQPPIVVRVTCGANLGVGRGCGVGQTNDLRRNIWLPREARDDVLEILNRYI
jgi:hypothetical protein